MTSTRLWRPAVLVQWRVCVGCSVSRAHKTWSPSFLFKDFHVWIACVAGAFSKGMAKGNFGCVRSAKGALLLSPLGAVSRPNSLPFPFWCLPHCRLVYERPSLQVYPRGTIIHSKRFPIYQWRRFNSAGYKQNVKIPTISFKDLRPMFIFWVLALFHSIL